MIIDPVTQRNLFPPMGLNSSGVACWFSIVHLILDASSRGIPCYMWTLTFADVVPDSWAGNMHSKLVKYMRDSVRSGAISEFAGVRVVEEHPGGHGLHYHWVIRGKLALSEVRKNAKRAGFGHVFIARDVKGRFRVVDAGAAAYLAKYLNKNEKLHGVRAWACIGTYEGTKTRDVSFDSDSTRVFRHAFEAAKQAGKPRGVCYNAGVLAQRRFDSGDETDSQGGFRPRAEATGEPAGMFGDARPDLVPRKNDSVRESDSAGFTQFPEEVGGGFEF